MEPHLYGQQSSPGAGPGGSAAYLPLAVFLCLAHLPGRLCLKPLGNLPRNAPKYFALNDILALARDQKWLNKASDALVARWATQNSKKEAQ
jgi:hypothetical protein